MNKAKQAIPAYQNAIANLPKSDLTPAQRKQKKQYEDGLHEAEELMQPKNADVVTLSEDQVEEMPYTRGLKFLKEIEYAPVPTCVCQET